MVFGDTNKKNSSVFVHVQSLVVSSLGLPTDILMLIHEDKQRQLCSESDVTVLANDPLSVATGHFWHFSTL